MSVPTWDFVSETYVGNDNYAGGDGIVYVDNGGISGALFTDMSTILQQHTGSTGGVEVVNSILSTDISQLPTADSFNIDDYVMAVNNPSDGSALDLQIGVSNFISSFVGEGLSVNGGQLTLDTGTSIIPDSDSAYDLGSGTSCWDKTYTNSLILCPYASTGDAGVGILGEVIYVTSENTLGVWTSTGWMKVVLTTF